MIFHLKSKFGQVSPKPKSHCIYFKICTRGKLKVIKTVWQKYIKKLRLIFKFGQIGAKITVSLNLHENWHTSQFEDNHYKFRLGEMFVQCSIFVILA